MTLRFADGTPIPDDEVHYNPDVGKSYSAAFHAAMAARMEHLHALVARHHYGADAAVWTDGSFEDFSAADLAAYDAEWEETDHPRKKTGEFAPKGAGEGAAPTLPAKPVIKANSPNNKEKQKHLDALEKHAEACEWDKVAAYPTPGINTYAKMVAKYKRALLASKGTAKPAAKNDLDKFTYEEGDLELLEEGDGPTLDEIIRRKRDEEGEPDDIGAPDPGFRAPRPR